MTRTLRSTAFRIALAFAVALTVTTYLVLALIYIQFYTANVALARSVLQDEVTKSLNVPIDRLKRQLDLRLTQDLRHVDYVGLLDPGGAVVFGNVPPGLRIPADGKAHLVKTDPTLPEPWQSQDVVFVAERRPDNIVLILGRSLVTVDELGSSMLRGFALALFPVILLALATGTIVSIRASRRLTTIQQAIERVMLGDLHVRLPARGTPDDVDSLVRAVNLMLDEIVRLLAQLKSVGDNIAHDLRSPLAVMRARLERGLTGSDEDLRRLTLDALGDLDRAMTTVSALLRISELESGLRRGAFDEVDLAMICRDAFELYELLGKEKGVSMTLAADTPVMVTGDADLLREAIANLIDNAVKFTPPGGNVRILCGASGSLVRVIDSGPGVAPDDREHIVKRFYRGATTSATPGIGLGLSMAATIVELHGFGLFIGENRPGAVFDIVPGSAREA